VTAFANASPRRAIDTVVVGSDCPGISASLVLRAFRLITRKQIVFGATTDGGFYAGRPAELAGVRV
jgi:glycosyltransferase A (GT-A) superfamily protein (DUF2064 family)